MQHCNLCEWEELKGRDIACRDCWAYDKVVKWLRPNAVTEREALMFLQKFPDVEITYHRKGVTDRVYTYEELVRKLEVHSLTFTAYTPTYTPEGRKAHRARQS